MHNSFSCRYNQRRARARARFRLRNRLRLREDPLCRRVVRIYMPRMHPPVFSLIQHRGAADAFKDHCLLIRSPFRLASVSMGIVVSFDTKCRSELSEPRITNVIILYVSRHGINPDRGLFIKGGKRKEILMK